MYQQVIDNATEKMKKTTSVYQTELLSAFCSEHREYFAIKLKNLS